MAGAVRALPEEDEDEDEDEDDDEEDVEEDEEEDAGVMGEARRREMNPWTATRRAHSSRWNTAFRSAMTGEER